MASGKLPDTLDSSNEQEYGVRSLNQPKTWGPKRRELLGWFRSRAEPLAEAYEGAIRLLDEVSFPGRIHFIAHAVRDITDRLVFVLDPQLKGNRVQYENQMDDISKLWPELGTFQRAGASPTTDDEIGISYRLASKIDLLVRTHRERRQRPSNYELLFRFLMRQEPSRADLNQRLVSDFKDIHTWFMKLTHLRESKAPDVDETDLQAQFNRFEGMLHSFVGRFFTGTAELDEILQQANE